MNQNAYESTDDEKAKLVSLLIAGGILAGAEEAALRIADLHGKPRHADEVCAMADLLIEDPLLREQVKLAAALVVLGEWNSPAAIMLGGRLTDEEKRAHIFPINARVVEVLSHVPGGACLAEAIAGKVATGVGPWLHVCRDISAIEAPRKWRQDDTHPDGRLTPQEMHKCLLENDTRPGRDPAVTAQLFARY